MTLPEWPLRTQLLVTESAQPPKGTRKVQSALLYHVDEATAYFRGAFLGGPSPAGLTT